MANQNSNTTISEQVRQHGEMLARLTVIVEEDHKDLDGLKKSTEIIAQAMALQQQREAMQAGLKARIKEVLVPLLAVLVGSLAGHFLPH